MAQVGMGLLANWIDVPPEIEADFDAWYVQEHLAERVAVPGFQNARRFIRADGGTPHKHLAIYETSDVAMLASKTYLDRLRQLSPWSQQIMPRFVAPRRLCCRCVAASGSGVGAYVVAQRFAPQAGLTETLSAQAGLAIGLPGFVAAHVWVNELAVARAGAPNTPADSDGEIAVFVEGCDAASTEEAARFDGVTPTARGTYRFVHGLSR
jgi:hypothetical protein